VSGDVFIVDDSADNLAVLSGMLRAAGYSVRVANGGRRALEAIAARPPELVLLDINMPDLDGYQVCKALHEQPASRDLPVVFLSALDDARDKVNAFRAGGADYVTKPFQAEEVLARVEHHLGLARLRRALEEKNRALEEKNRALVQAWNDADQLFAALSERLPGTRLDDRYRLESRIGVGGSAAVYRATDEETGRPVAVKILRPQAGPHAERWRDRFLQEWGTSNVIQHPNAVVLYDAGLTAMGLPYLVMELLEGESLADEMARKGVLSLRRTAQVLAPVCRMLAQAHLAGLVHRDIKPANIFLHRPEGQAGAELVKVVDFGIAKLFERNELDEVTTLGHVVGTPMYMSPERLLGEPCDGGADVFAVAVTCYQALSGRYPYQSEEGSVQAAIYAVLSAPLSPLSRWREGLPPDLEPVLARALSREAKERPGMAELGALFESLLERSGLEEDPESTEAEDDPEADTVIAWPPRSES
jgi:CheY-like chemotaxis protein